MPAFSIRQISEVLLWQAACNQHVWWPVQAVQTTWRPFQAHLPAPVASTTIAPVPTMDEWGLLHRVGQPHRRFRLEVSIRRTPHTAWEPLYMWTEELAPAVRPHHRHPQLGW
jgi:hypothetical protein